MKFWIKSTICKFLVQLLPKGQLILKCHFGVFKSPKKPTKIFCPSIEKEVKSKK